MTRSARYTFFIFCCLVASLTSALFPPSTLAAPNEDKEFHVRTFSKPGPTKWLPQRGRGSFEEDRLILISKKSMTDEEIAAAVKEAHGQLISIMDVCTKKLIVIQTNKGFFDKAENKLKANKMFSVVGRNYQLKARSGSETPVAIAGKPVKTPTSTTPNAPVVNDMYFPNQWGLKAINAASVLTQFINPVKTYASWPPIKVTSVGNFVIYPPVIGSIGFIDGGCSTTPPDLSGQKVFGGFYMAYGSDYNLLPTGGPGIGATAGPIYSFKNFFPDANALPDWSGHGTAVASVACARANDNIGIAGVCPGCYVVPFKVTCGHPPTSYSYAVALNIGSHYGPRVMSCSLGPEGSTILNDTIVMDGVNHFATCEGPERLHPGGGLLFAAAGETNDGMTYGGLEPGSLNDNVIFVGSIGPDYKIAGNSNFGGAIQFYMPGVDILTCDRSGAILKLTGTSYATPMAAAAAALVWWSNPALTRSQVLSILRRTASNGGLYSGQALLGGDGRKTGYGVIDVGAAVSAARY